MRKIDADALHEEISKWPESVMYKDWVQSTIAHAPTLIQQAEPLTVEQLQQMDGQPVRIKRLKGLSVCDTGWALIDICPDREEKLYDIRVWWPGGEVEDEPSEEDYGKTWVAYGRPPEEET